MRKSPLRLTAGLAYVALAICIVMWSPPARADRCQSDNGLALCSCSGQCEKSTADCRCKSANDPGVPLLCKSLDGQREAMCFCEVRAE